MSKHLIDLKNITKTYDDTDVLKDINLYIRDGEFLTLLGPSGCGKTTMLRLIAGFTLPDNGQILVDGKDISGVPPYRRQVNTVFQKYALFPHLNVFDNIAFGLKIQKLLDEPMGALDLKLRKGMQIELKRMQQKLGITFIYVTHDQEEALTMSDTIVVMNEGVIQQIGTPADIYNEPKNVFVAKFIGESNIIPGVMLEDYKVRFHDIDFECVDAGFGCNTPVDVVVRPEDIDIMPLGKTALKGTIKSVLFMGVHYEFRIETGSFTWTVHSTDYVAPDTEISLEIVPDAIHIMHKSLKHDEQELLTEDEIADAAAAAEEE